MRIRHISLLAIAATALGVNANTFSSEPDASSVKSRAEVRAEAAAVMQAGPTESGEVNSTVADKSFVPSRSREEVRAEAIAAQQPSQDQSRVEGSIVPDQAAPPALSREQVRAEAIEAVRLGVPSRGESARELSASELESIRQAGLRANPRVSG